MSDDNKKNIKLTSINEMFGQSDGGQVRAIRPTEAAEDQIKKVHSNIIAILEEKSLKYHIDPYLSTCDKLAIEISGPDTNIPKMEAVLALFNLKYKMRSLADYSIYVIIEN